MEQIILTVSLLSSNGSDALEGFREFFGWLGNIFSFFMSIFGIFAVIFIIPIITLLPLTDQFRGSLEEEGVEIAPRALTSFAFLG